MKNFENKTKIARVSRVLRMVLLAGLVVQMVGMVAGMMSIWFFASQNALNLKSQIAFENIGAYIALPFGFMVTLNFFRFFSRLKDGQLFDAQTITHLLAAGRWWVGYGIIRILLDSIDAFLFSPAHLSISANTVLAGLIVIFTAWLFGEARGLQEEHDLTV